MPEAILDTEETITPSDAVRVPNLGRRAARGGAVVLASTAANRLLNLSITAVLARILTPVEYGQLGMVLTLTFVIGLVSDLGMTTATIQKRDLQQSEASAAFWLNLLFGTILFGITVLLAPSLAAFYREPELQRLTILCGSCFPITALSSQHIAMMVRRMEFKRVAICDLSGVVGGGVVGILMARWGYGVQALAGQMIGLATTSAVMSWLLGRWVPSLPQRSAGVGGILRFGGYLTGFNLVNYLSRNLDNVLVGRVWGPESLGLYTRAYSLMLYPIALVSGPLARVALPTLSQFQNDYARMRDAYVRILTVIGFITFPMMTLLFASAEDVIALVYGRKWDAAVPLFRVLCIAGVYQGIYSAAGQVLTATGRTDRMMRLGVGIAVVLCSAFFIGIRWGAIGVATSYVIGSAITLIPYLKYVYATIDLRMKTAFKPLMPTLAAALVAGGASLGLQSLISEKLPPILRLLVSGSAGAAIYLCILVIFWREELTRMFSQVTSWLKPASPN